MTNPTGDAAKPLREWSDEELSIKIAELLGEDYHKPTPGELASGSYYQYEPRYSCDLNAMHEAWKWYRWNKANQFFFLDYQRALWRVVTGREEQVPDIDYMHSMAMESVIHATARQRAEAFVSTLTGEQP